MNRILSRPDPTVEYPNCFYSHILRTVFSLQELVDLYGSKNVFSIRNTTVIILTMKRVYAGRKDTHNDPTRAAKSVRRQPPLNRHQMVQEEASTSTSAKKLEHKAHVEVPVDPTHGYRILNFIAEFSAISNYVNCKTCGGNVKFGESSIRGLGFKVVILCDACENRSVILCLLIEGHAYEINRRFIFAMRCLGIGEYGMRKFCGLMDLPKCIYQSFDDKISNNILTAAQTVCQRSMKNAVNEEEKVTAERADKPLVITVSGDGTWRKRGFSSLHGVATLIGNFTKKVVDVCVKSSYCKECEYWQKHADTAEYAEWFEDHQNNCSANHEGCAGKMEVDAVKEMFARSEELHDVKYYNYVSDGRL